MGELIEGRRTGVAVGGGVDGACEDWGWGMEWREGADGWEVVKIWGSPLGPRRMRILVPSFSYSNSARLFLRIRSMTALISLISIEQQHYGKKRAEIKKKILYQ